MAYGYDDGVDILELFRLWRTQLTADEIQRKLGISHNRLYSLVKKHKLPRRSPIKVQDDETERQQKDPTEEEILARAAEIRSGWSEKEREKRCVSKKVQTWSIPTYTYEPQVDRFTGNN